MSFTIFNSLSAAQSLHNCVLKAVAGIVLQTKINLQVSYITNKDNNIRADLLSHFLFIDYQHQFPADCVHTFEPPQHLLPAQWRKSF